MSMTRRLAPELENGAVMSREEFHAAYADCHEFDRVELIEGVVYLPSPIKVDSHADPHGLILLWLGTYAADKPGIRYFPPASILLDDQNEPEPDAILLKTTAGWLSDDGYIAKAPELVVEIAGSSQSRDLNQKKRAYERNGIAEYIVWQPTSATIEWFELQDGRYVLRSQDTDGRIESRQFPGLVMDVAAMVNLDRLGALAAIRS